MSRLTENVAAIIPNEQDPDGCRLTARHPDILQSPRRDETRRQIGSDDTEDILDRFVPRVGEEVVEVEKTAFNFFIL